MSTTDLADEGEGLPPNPLGTVAEPDGELVDEVQAQVIGPTCIELLQDLYNLRAQQEMTHLLQTAEKGNSVLKKCVFRSRLQTLPEQAQLQRKKRKIR